MSVSDGVATVREGIAAACNRSGRDPDSVELMAVSKFNPLEAMREAYAAGIRLFGESRVQEASTKAAGFASSCPEASLEMIGHLQSNKTKTAVAVFARIQSCDSLGMMSELDSRCAQAGKVMPVLLELHTGEESKAGFPDIDSLKAALDALPDLTHLEVQGFMTMAPYTKEEAPIRQSFRSLAKAKDILSSRYRSVDLRILSMGMTNDYGIAVEEGSTLLRVGTAIFGRQP